MLSKEDIELLSLVVKNHSHLLDTKISQKKISYLKNSGKEGVKKLFESDEHGFRLAKRIILEYSSLFISDRLVDVINKRLSPELRISELDVFFDIRYKERFEEIKKLDNVQSDVIFLGLAEFCKKNGLVSRIDDFLALAFNRITSKEERNLILGSILRDFPLYDGGLTIYIKYLSIYLNTFSDEKSLDIYTSTLFPILVSLAKLIESNDEEGFTKLEELVKPHFLRISEALYEFIQLLIHASKAYGNEELLKKAYNYLGVLSKNDNYIHSTFNFKQYIVGFGLSKFPKSLFWKDLNEDGNMIDQKLTMDEISEDYAYSKMYLKEYIKVIKNLDNSESIKDFGSPTMRDAIKLTKSKNWLSTNRLFAEFTNLYNKALYKANISLTQVKIKQYKGFENLTINFSPKINIILGKNGFGKTSILQALALNLLPENDRDTIRLQTEGFEGLTKQGAEKVELEVAWENDFLQRKVVIENKEKSIVEEGEFVEFVPKMVFLAYGTNTFISDSKNKFSTRVQEVIAEVPKWYHTQSLFSDYNDEFVDPIDFFNEMERYEFHDVDEKKAEIKLAKDYLIRILNELIPNKYRIQKNKTNYFFVDEQGNQLKTQQLSEGYRANVILLTDMLTRLLSLREEMNSSLGEEEKIPIDKAFEQMKGIIAIDEFDRHLHPTWQRDFVNKLAKYFPKIQFVLTTHNPMAILDRAEDEVHQIIENAEGNYEVVKHEGGTKNMDVVVALLKYFETDSVVSTNLQEKLDRYYLLLETEPENPEVEELLQEIKNAYLGITIPDYKYLTYLKFLREKGIDLNDRKSLDSIDFDNPEWDGLADEISKILN
jgi:predicted ATP-binding protein involved in virulence